MAGDRPLAIVTGAAGGMGRATAAKLSSDYDLLLCDVRAEPLAQMAAAHAGAQTFVGDFRQAAGVDGLVAAVGGRPIAALAHTAGLSPTMADPETILMVNLAATIRLVDAVESRMAAGGAAVLIASMAGAMAAGPQLDGMLAGIDAPDDVAQLVPAATNSGAAYSFSKRGVQLIAKRRAKRWGARGARIVSLSPGIIDTPMGQLEMGVTAEIGGMVAASALARMGRSEEIATAVAFLCSSAASFVTGTDLLVDGGAVAALSSMG
jgi:NAD(P)-dependent dehydrogenase (short-subunit alcohol dehydrogenase family)